ncbi:MULTISPECIES: ubiquitin-like protein Pup [unclassified Actinobaculum]|jgi:ubiquitin-like protein Pup|uniref:ubiquitin-like protein Pup n=1 Tax=unclassified Actinobaculum TaxID=2609299 RepID=UPI000D5270AF|nr:MULTISPECIES: ubiquitin-like protein Pup [unclassified Actinobaculum]AWE42350.1 ubiquitin-like protein Pup [Actinobaculum sp. 313]MBE6483463.1 ubiquitin-like protein Pup [Actinomycetaceae bacterium]RTE50924.1 ubiquitin-like protein Pup [Actinobaculum sp. 352]
MSQQEFAQPRRTVEEQTETELPQVQVSTTSSEVDSLLDEIDSVLEQNASAFVQGFVQKGGQ